MNLHVQSTRNIISSSCSIQSLSWLPQSNTNGLTGWLAISNALGVTGIACTNLNDNISKSYNLYTEHHKSKIAHIKWNDTTQMLTTCDEHGNICQWMPGSHNLVIGARYKLNYPPTTSEPPQTVVDIAWSHKGKILVVCFSDGFLSILEEEDEERRSYTFMNPISDCVFTCLAFDPDDNQILLGTTDGFLVVVNIQGNAPTIHDSIRLTRTSVIQCIAWSCPRFYTQETHCIWQNKNFNLGIGFKNGMLHIQESYDNLSPVRVQTNLYNIMIQWNTNGEFLAVAGQRRAFKIKKSSNAFFNFADSYTYVNAVSIYNKNGTKLTFSVLSDHCSLIDTSRVRGIHWAHRDSCLFVAGGSHIYTARVMKDPSAKIATLQQMCCIKICALIEKKKYLAPTLLPPALQTLFNFLLKPVISYPLPTYDFTRRQEFLSHQPKEYIHCTLKKRSNSVYTLYMEFLGKLIPLLGAIKSSRRNTEFMILDPKQSDRMSNCLIKKQQSCEGEKESKTKQLLRKCKRCTKIKDLPENNPKAMEIKEVEPTQALAVVHSNTWKTQFKIKQYTSKTSLLLAKINYNPSFLHMMPRKINIELVCRKFDENIKKYILPCNLSDTYKKTLLVDTSNKEIRVAFFPKLPLLIFHFDCKENVFLPKDSFTYTKHNCKCSSCHKNNIIDHLHNWTWVIQKYTLKRLKFSLYKWEDHHMTYENKSTNFFKQSSEVVFINTISSKITFTFIEDIHEDYEFLNKLVANKSDSFFPAHCTKLWDISINRKSRMEYFTSRYSQHLKLHYFEHVQMQLPLSNVSPHRKQYDNFKQSLGFHKFGNNKKKFQATHVLQNKAPTWNKTLCIYQLDCGGRVTVESEKNCQFEYNGQQSLQFGRIGISQFTLDFRYPFTPLHAFAVALTSLTHGMK